VFRVLAVSDSIIVALLGLAGITVTAAGAFLGLWVTRETRKQDTKVNKVVSDFEAEYESRGLLIAGLRADGREQHCLDALEHAHNRIAVLEERLKRDPG
jgi:hypothetical protein